MGFPGPEPTAFFFTPKNKENHDVFAYAAATMQQPLLKESEVKDLLSNTATDKAIETVVLGSLRLVCKHVYRWARFAKRHGIELDDLSGAGNIGLLRGVLHYSSNKGHFYLYISQFIRAYVLNAVFGHFGYSRRVCQRMMKQKQDIDPVKSLDSSISDNDEDTPQLLADIMPHQQDQNAFVALEINHLLSMLDDREKAPHRLSKEVIELRYSVGSKLYQNHPMSLAEVGRVLKLSKEAIRKIELKTLRYFKARLACPY